QKRKDEICPFSSLAFFQPTTVDKEPFCLAPNGARRTNSHLIKKRTISKTKKFDIMRHVLN
nr:hypothetical protein [Streptococcus pneumoniae]